MARILLFLPPLFLGAVLTASGFLAAGMLLYSGEGVIRALSVIAAVEVGSFAVGLRMGGLGGGDPIDSLRKRWLTALLAFLAAALYAGGWSFLGDGASRPLSLGLGLALLGALPMYGGGSVLGAMVHLAQVRGRPVALPLVWAGAGGAVGFLLSGVALQPRVFPVTFYMMALVLLSGGSLLEALLLSALESRDPETDHSASSDPAANGGSEEGPEKDDEAGPPPSAGYPNGQTLPGGNVPTDPPGERETEERRWNESSGSGPGPAESSGQPQ